jgi:hypothetical protein
VYVREDKHETDTRRNHRTGVWSLLIVLLLVATLVPVPGSAIGQEATPVVDAWSNAEFPSNPEPDLVEAEVADAVVTGDESDSQLVVPSGAESGTDDTTTMPMVDPQTETDAAQTESEPVVIPDNTDTLWIADGVSEYSLQQGESVTIPVTYSVTTPRTSTTIAAELVNATEGWSISAAGFADGNASATVGNWLETATLEPGASFTMSLTITAPATVDADHSVGLRVWSTAAGVNGKETGVAWTDTLLASVTVVSKAAVELAVAAAGDPSIECVPLSTMIVEAGVVVIEANGTADYSCTVVDGPVKLALGPGGITQGWWFSIDNSTFGDTVASSSAQVNGELSVSMKLADPAVNPGPGSLELAITRRGVGNTTILDTATLLAKVPQAATTPSVSIDDFAFSPLTWNGTSWGTTSGSTKVAIQRDQAGDFGDFAIQIQLIHTPYPGALEPFLTSSASTSGGISTNTIVQNPILSPVTVATVTPDFSGTGQVDLSFGLTPSDRVPPSEHTMTIRVTTVNAP